MRWSRGRFARDTDLHQVAGMIVLSFLLMWGLTGAGYDVGFVAKAWYAALPGNDEHSHFKSAAPADEMNPAPDITPQQAVERAATLYRTSRPPSSGTSTVAIAAVTNRAAGSTLRSVLTATTTCPT